MTMGELLEHSEVVAVAVGAIQDAQAAGVPIEAIVGAARLAGGIANLVTTLLPTESQEES